MSKKQRQLITERYRLEPSRKAIVPKSIWVLRRQFQIEDIHGLRYILSTKYAGRTHGWTIPKHLSRDFPLKDAAIVVIRRVNDGWVPEVSNDA